MYKYIGVLFASIVAMSSASAAPIFWTDWTSNSDVNGVSTTLGNIATTGSVIGVTYENANGIAGAQLGNMNDRDYYANGASGIGGRDDSISPYTSSAVDNAPTNTDIVRLRFAGEQKLSFTESVANLVFAYVSLNSNGYRFTQDFDILSFGDSTDGNACGYWGCGTSTKTTSMINGITYYDLVGTGEPHGAIQFKGALSSITWESLTAENWNGFTVGVQGTEAEVDGELSSPAIGLFMIAGFGLLLYRRR